METIKIVYKIAEEFHWNKTFNKKGTKYWTIAQWIWIAVFKILEKNIDYRDLEDRLRGWSDIRNILKLKRVPDYSTINRNLRKITKDMMDDINHILLLFLQGDLSSISAEDSTWLKLDNRSSYFSKRSGKKRKFFVKLWLSVDINNLALYGFTTWLWPWNDIKIWEQLKLLTKDKHIWVRLKDSWFDWGNNIEDVVPPIARWWTIKSQERLARKNEVSILKDCWLFGYRWMVETVYSVIKRKFTDNIREKLDSSRITISNLIALTYMVRL